MGSNYLKKKYKNTIKELSKASTKDKIFAYYLDSESVKLTDKEEVIHQRWIACFSLLIQYHSPMQVVNVMKQRFGISDAQAYRDLRDSADIFGDVTATSKNAYRHILFEFAMKVFQLAATKNDLGEMNKSLITMVKLKGLDKEDPDLPDFSLLQNNNYEIKLEPSQQEQLMKMLSKGVINVDDLLK